MTLTQQIITIGLCVLGTMLTRFLPFWVFRGGQGRPMCGIWGGPCRGPSSACCWFSGCFKGEIALLPGKSVRKRRTKCGF